MEDDDLFEIRANATNELFSGTADIYLTREDIIELAKSLKGFPENINQTVSFTTGENEDISYFTLKFKCVDGSGHIIVRVKIAYIVTDTARPKKHYISEFDINIEAASVDQFVISLHKLATSELGEISAILNGKT